MLDTTNDAKIFCLKLLKKHFENGWSNAKLDEMKFERVLGGCTSLIFYCSASDCQPNQLIIRFHYANDEENSLYDLKFIGECAENLVFYILSDLSFGPKLYSVFNGGRIEEYIPSRQLTDEDITSGCFNKAIIEKISFIHSIDMPIKKDHKWIINFFNNYEQLLIDLENNEKEMFLKHENNRNFNYIKQIFDFNVRKEFKWFISCLNKLKLKLVFSHNDITKRNILIKKDDNLSIKEKVVIIDFGDCSYNYRGLDLADFLRCKICLDKVLKYGQEFSHYIYNENEINEICKWYLNQKLDDKLNENLNQLKFEIYFFFLLSDLMTILYITISLEKYVDNEENWIYAVNRVALYNYSKNMFFKKYRNQVEFNEYS